MQPQREITSPCDLLDENGHLTVEGWARRPYWNYDRSKIQASWFRIKEWDYYYILSQDRKYGITVTVSDLGYLGLMAVCWLDFAKQTATQYDRMIFFPKGKTNLPPTSGDGRLHYKDKHLEVSFDVQFTIKLLKNKKTNWPRAENQEYIMTIGNARPLDQALQHATTEMVRWLQEDYALEGRAAYILLGQCVEYEVGNVYDPAYTMVCKLKKKWLQR